MVSCEGSLTHDRPDLRGQGLLYVLRGEYWVKIDSGQFEPALTRTVGYHRRDLRSVLETVIGESYKISLCFISCSIAILL